MLTGQNGILNRAGEAKEKNGTAQKEEALKISVMDALSNGLGEITDSNLKKALNNNLGTEGEDYEIVGSEECGWTVTIKENEKDYKISSKGEIGEIEKVEGSKSDWEVEGNAVVKYLGSSENIVVPNYIDGVKITEIGDNIFKNSEIDGTLKISEGIKVIDEHAFDTSKFEGNLVLPNTIKEIKDYAFAGWTGNLENLVIPSTLKQIPQGLFASSSGFKGTLTINDGPEEIGKSAFLNCTGFEGSLVIPDSVKIIGDSAFGSCKGFEKLVLSNKLESIGNSAFISCSGFRGELIIPNTVKEIDSFAFCGCSSFSGDLTIPNSIQKLGVDYLFTGMTLTGTLDLGSGEGIKNGISYDAPRKITKLIVRTNCRMIGESSFIANLSNLKSCWLSSDAIKNMNKQLFYGAIPDIIIYTDVTEENAEWPDDWNIHNLKVVYGISVEEYMNM